MSLVLDLAMKRKNVNMWNFDTSHMQVKLDAAPKIKINLGHMLSGVVSAHLQNINSMYIGDLVVKLPIHHHYIYYCVSPMLL